ncbi:MAG TPA: aldo/keto reductase [Steroidobacteraceae bacterium]|nr:aldo/keto reductase [Steroidobacteraceae bacterium]
MANIQQQTPLRAPRGEFTPGELAPESTVDLRGGARMPVLGMGSWMLTSHTAESVLHAFELGYRMVDTSRDYHTQSGIGRAILRSDVPREALFISMKVEENEDGYEATVKNLKELKLAYADLVLIHRAPKTSVGEKVWRGLMQARDEGLTRSIGVCSYKIAQIQALADQTGEMPAVHQIEWSPFGHSLDMLNFCRANDIVVQAYSPLTRGKRLKDERLAGIAMKHGKTPAQVILRWDLQHGVVPIPKAYREDHQRQNIALFDFELDAGDMAMLDGLNERFSALDGLEYLNEVEPSSGE